MENLPWKVDIIQCELGWGQRTDRTHTFTHYKDACDFRNKFNDYNAEHTAPDWYIYATEPYQSA
jgi:hypothetical protein